MSLIPFGVRPARTPIQGSRSSHLARKEESQWDYMPIVLIIWGVFVACLLGLLAYNATLTRYEEDQLFLSDTNPSRRASK